MRRPDVQKWVVWCMIRVRNIPVFVLNVSVCRETDELTYASEEVDYKEDDYRRPIIWLENYR